MAERLLNKVAVITGAGGGIGRAIAEQFLGEGAKVVLFGRRDETLEEIAQTAPARALSVVGDVTVAGDLAQLVGAMRRRFGEIDVLLPCAGVARALALEACTEQAVAEQFAVNVIGALQTVRFCLPLLGEGATVLFLTAHLPQINLPGLSIHNAGKAALTSLTQSLAVELAPRGIRVNSIAPGPIDTPLWADADLPADVLHELSKRLGRPEDVAETAVFLASEAAQNISGQEFVVSGTAPGSPGCFE